MRREPCVGLRRKGETAMRRIATMVCAATLSVVLAACGGGAAEQAPAADEASAATTEQAADTPAADDATAAEPTKSEAKEEPAAKPADPSEKFTGDWEIAAMEMGGLTIAGDLSSFADEDTMNATLSLDEDGNGSMTLGSDAQGNVTWKLVSDDSIELIAVPQSEDDEADEDEDEEPKSFTATYADDALVLDMSGIYDEDDPDDADDVAVVGTNPKLYFSRDGKLAAYPAVDVSAATRVTDEKSVMGDWKFAALCYEKAIVYGDASALSSMFGVEDNEMFSTDITFNDDGSATFGKMPATWSKDDDGLSFAEEDGGEASIAFTADIYTLDENTLVLKANGLFESFNMSYVFKRG